MNDDLYTDIERSTIDINGDQTYENPNFDQTAGGQMS